MIILVWHLTFSAMFPAQPGQLRGLRVLCPLRTEYSTATKMPLAPARKSSQYWVVRPTSGRTQLRSLSYWVQALFSCCYLVALKPQFLPSARLSGTCYNFSIKIENYTIFYTLENCWKTFKIPKSGTQSAENIVDFEYSWIIEEVKLFLKLVTTKSSRK